MIEVTGNTTGYGEVPTKTFLAMIRIGQCPHDQNISHLAEMYVQGSHIVGVPTVSSEYDGPVRPCPNGCLR